mgnify:CR=1 FL=1
MRKIIKFSFHSLSLTIMIISSLESFLLRLNLRAAQCGKFNIFWPQPPRLVLSSKNMSLVPKRHFKIKIKAILTVTSISNQKSEF